MSGFARLPKAKWLAADFPTDVTNLDPMPEDAPAVPASVRSLVKLAEAGGWEARTGYSRSRKRGQKTGSYRPIEVFGVWLSPGHPSGWRASALYERFIDAKAEWTAYEDGAYRQTVATEGKPGSWSWRIRIFSGLVRHDVKVTPLKDFLTVRGSVLPSWFDKHGTRVQEPADEEATDDAEE